MGEQTETFRDKAESQILYVTVPASGVITGAGEREEEVSSEEEGKEEVEGVSSER